MTNPLEELAVSSAVALANLPHEESACLTNIGSNAIKLFRLYTYPESRGQFQQQGQQNAQSYLQGIQGQYPQNGFGHYDSAPSSNSASPWAWWKSLTNTAGLSGKEASPPPQARLGKHLHGHGHHGHGPHSGESHHAAAVGHTGGIGAQTHSAGAGSGSGAHGAQGVFGGAAAAQSGHAIGHGHEGAGSAAQEHSVGWDKKGHWDVGVDYGFHFNKTKASQVEHSEESSWACVNGAYDFYRKIAGFDVYSFFDFAKRHENEHAGVHEHGGIAGIEKSHGFYVS